MGRIRRAGSNPGTAPRAYSAVVMSVTPECYGWFAACRREAGAAALPELLAPRPAELEALHEMREPPAGRGGHRGRAGLPELPPRPDLPCSICGLADGGRIGISRATGTPVCERCRKRWVTCSGCGTGAPLKGGTLREPRPAAWSPTRRSTHCPRAAASPTCGRCWSPRARSRPATSASPPWKAGPARSSPPKPVPGTGRPCADAHSGAACAACAAASTAGPPPACRPRTCTTRSPPRRRSRTGLTTRRLTLGACTQAELEEEPPVGRRPAAPPRGVLSGRRPGRWPPRDQPPPGPQHRPVHPGRRGPGRHPGQGTRHPRPGRDPVAEDLRRGLDRLCRRHQRPATVTGTGYAQPGPS